MFTDVLCRYVFWLATFLYVIQCSVLHLNNRVFHLERKKIHTQRSTQLSCSGSVFPSIWGMVLNGLQWSSDGIPGMWNLRESLSPSDTFSVRPSPEEGQCVCVCVCYGKSENRVHMVDRTTRICVHAVMIRYVKSSFKLVHSLHALHVCLVVATLDLCVWDCAHLDLTLHTSPLLLRLRCGLIVFRLFLCIWKNGLNKLGF